jgi:hypothetical protein
MIHRNVLGAAGLAVMLLVGPGAHAQAPAPAAAAARPVPPTAQAAALVDLEGYWVSVVTEDWRWRMITPPKGDYASLPLNPAGRKAADEFDPAQYGGASYQTSQVIDCRAYGAAGLMRMPTRLHITWEGPNDLKIESDWGGQTRVLHFEPGQPFVTPQHPAFGRPGAPPTSHGVASAQGYSVAAWEQAYRYDANAYERGPVSRRAGLGVTAMAQPQPGGSLVAQTTELAPGWLRRNGVPYSGRTRMTEHFQTFTDPTGAVWFDVATEVIDPEFLTDPFITSSDFQKEPDGSKWAIHACKQVAGK